MARFGTLHRNAPVDLPPDVSGPTALTAKRVRPAAKVWIGLVGFIGYGSAVIVTACLLAMQIQ